MYRQGLVALAAFTLAGCAIPVESPPTYYYSPSPMVATPSPVVVTPSPVVVMQSPPPPRVEVVPMAPAATYAWVPGYWGWNGRSYYWVGGRYIVRPSTRAYWVPGHWQRRGNGWIFISGHWS
jgi:hypothetical protein